MEEIQEYWHLERWRGSFGRYQSLNEYLSALFASHSSELVNPDLLYIVNSMKTFSGYYERDYHHVRGKYNPYECLGKGPKDNPYLNRSALKLANLDSIFSILHPSDGIFLWADICGGPGGFSEYILTRFGDDMKLIGYGMSMVHPQGSSCNWNLDYLHDPPRIAIIEDLQSKIDSDKLFFIHHGEDTTGNILHRPNIEAFEHFILSKSDDGVDFFCGDGGMEDGRDKEDQEMIHLPLILSQIIAMIGVLRTHGSFLLKTFSLFKFSSAIVFYLLTLLFEDMTIVKPITSRPTSSERYVFCSNFRSFSREERKEIQNILWEYQKSFSCVIEREEGEPLTSPLLESFIPFQIFLREVNDTLLLQQFYSFSLIFRHLLHEDESDGSCLYQHLDFRKIEELTRRYLRLDNEIGDQENPSKRSRFTSHESPLSSFETIITLLEEHYPHLVTRSKIKPAKYYRKWELY